MKVKLFLLSFRAGTNYENALGYHVKLGFGAESNCRAGLLQAIATPPWGE